MIISVLNQKGGVGKTTTTLNLGTALAEAGHRVLLLDLDLQRDLVAHEAALAGANITFAATDADELSVVLKAHEFDFALLDCPPSLGDETGAALKVSQLALVPVAAEFLAVRGLGRVLEVIAAGKRVNRTLQTRLLVTMLDRRSDHGPTVQAAVQAVPGAAPFQTAVPRSVAFAKASAEGQSVLQFAPKSPGADAFRALAEEVANLKS